jgi:large subunit ribosomal protein L9
MQVILLERIEKLGQMGDVVNVKAGYARNFLLPKKKAMRATNSNQAVFEQQRTQLEADNLQRRQEAESVSVKIDGINVTIIRQAGDSGQLYGSVTARDVSESVTEAGATVNRNQILLNKPIKALGVYETRVALHPEVTVNITVNIARTEEEAKLQLEAGSALINMDQFEENERDTATEEALAIADNAEAEVAATEGLVEEEVSDNLTSELLKESTSGGTDSTSEGV